MENYLETFEREGCVCIPDFLSENNLEEIRASMSAIIEEMDVSKQERASFKTSDDQVKVHNEYFLNSADKISYFFEQDALDETGDLLVAKERSLNKVGHALHWYNKTFKKISFSEKVKDLARSLDLVKPAVIQSMYIFKHPKIGGEVTPHTDRTFLYNEPCKLVGLWFPIEDATLENGCLWYIPESHKKYDITRRMVRGAITEEGLLKFTGHQPVFADSDFVPVEAKAGSLVLIDGKVVHKSEKNLSKNPRPAYTFHMIDTHETKYAADNWLQPTANLPFTMLFEN